MNSEETVIKDKLSEYYGDFMSEEYCACMCEELKPLLEQSSRYRKSILEWKNGKSTITDIFVPKVGGEPDGFWALSEIATRLDQIHPNVPVAAFLLFLSEQNPATLSAILSVAEKLCLADSALIEQEGRKCTCAFLDEENCEWVFLTETSQSAEFKKYQMWQVLLQVPALVFPISYDFQPGTSIQLWNDGIYHIVPPEYEDELKG